MTSKRRRAIAPSMERAASRRTLLLVVVIASAAVAAACSAGTDDNPVVALNATTTTIRQLGVADAAPSSVPPVPPAEMKSRLDAALAAKDFCAFYGTIDSSVPDVSDHAAVVAAYGILSDEAVAATGIVPPEVRTDWDVITQGITAGAKAVKASKGDLGDPSVRMVFEAQAMANSQSVIERWLGEHCAAPR